MCFSYGYVINFVWSINDIPFEFMLQDTLLKRHSTFKNVQYEKVVNINIAILINSIP